MKSSTASRCFVYGVNTPSRWGTQAPFSNITLDWTVPADLAGHALPSWAARPWSFTYSDCKPEMDMINKAFIEVMIEGDANGRGFQYPIPTYSITKDFDWSETENNRLLFEMTAKYGTPYFSNYINSDMEPSDVRSMCCRLRLDLRELRKKTGGFFGSGESYRLRGRCDHQSCPGLLIWPRMRRISYAPAGSHDGHCCPLPEDQADHHRPGCWRRGCTPTPSATWAALTITFPPSASSA